MRLTFGHFAAKSTDPLLLELSSFQRKDAKMQRRRENKMSCCSVISSDGRKIKDIETSLLCYESKVISSLFSSSLRLCVFALKITEPRTIQLE